MSEHPIHRVAIVDYGLGNLFSIAQACKWAGLSPEITSSAKSVSTADAVILPGVGAFGVAMSSLRRLDIQPVLLDVAARGTPLLGICLGMQLLLGSSNEFGNHEGLGLIEGSVVRFPESSMTPPSFKIPHVGWNNVSFTEPDSVNDPRDLMSGIPRGAYMYFVHSYFTIPSETRLVTSEATYGGVTFASSFSNQNVVGVQFHPERSGSAGLKIYTNLNRLLDGRADRNEAT